MSSGSLSGRPAPAVQALAAQLEARPPERLFAVVDAAANGLLVDRLYADAAAQFDLLLPGTPPADVFHVAPFVVDLTDSCELRDWLLSGWGQAWGIFIVAAMTLDSLQRHLRPFVQASLPEGRLAYFRFYDPRVFASSIEALQPQRIDSLLAPLSAVYCEAADRTLVRFGASQGRLVRAVVHTGQ